MSKIIYLANNCGFSTQQKELLLPELVTELEHVHPDIVVWEPFARNNQIDFLDPDWAYDVGQADMDDVRNSDAIFAVLNGIPPDEGVMVELGMAIAWGKEVFLFRDDFRKCTDSGKYPLNLMIFTGLGKRYWEDHYYTNISEINDPNKALSKWANKQ